MTAIGYIAHRTLASGLPGTVFARFERSAYLDVGGCLICLASPAIDDGPLTVPCSDLPNLRAGDAYPPLTMAGAVWRPSLPSPGTMEAMAHALQVAAEMAAANSSKEGLSAFVSGPEPTPSTNLVVESARAPVGGLADWLEGAFGGDDVPAPDIVSGLVGLGPGLTPSGDDLLGGVMIAAHAVRRPDIAERIHEVVLTGDTGRISRAHLDAAREGAAAAPLHALLNHIVAGRAGDLPVRFAALSRMGHCSGWDAFAGCAIALRALCRSAYSS